MKPTAKRLGIALRIAWQISEKNTKISQQNGFYLTEFRNNNGPEARPSSLRRKTAITNDNTRMIRF